MLLEKKLLKTERISILVFDEADEMLDKNNFSQDSIRVVKQLPKGTQILCFSATYKDHVLQFAEKVVQQPRVKITLKLEELSLEKISQYNIICTDESHKFHVLSEIYGYISVGQSIIFVGKKVTAADLHKKMTAAGHTVSFLSSELDHLERDVVIDSFRSGQTKVLIATNIIARGIDINQVTLIINYDLPTDGHGQADPETYLHRVGRSGRWGRAGLTFNFIDNSTARRQITEISHKLRREIPDFPVANIPQLKTMLKQLHTS